jgi:hypothetical protein
MDGLEGVVSGGNVAHRVAIRNVCPRQNSVHLRIFAGGPHATAPEAGSSRPSAPPASTCSGGRTEEKLGVTCVHFPRVQHWRAIGRGEPGTGPRPGRPCRLGLERKTTSGRSFCLDSHYILGLHPCPSLNLAPPAPGPGTLILCSGRGPASSFRCSFRCRGLNSETDGERGPAPWQSEVPSRLARTPSWSSCSW